MNSIISNLYINSYEYVKDNVSLLQTSGVKCVISIGVSAPHALVDDFIYLPLGIDVKDTPESNLIPYMLEGAAFIADNIDAKGIIVHCVYGQSRSVSLCLAYLMLYKGLTLVQAMELMRIQHPTMCVNPGFLSQLHLLYYRSLYRYEWDYLSSSSSTSSFSLEPIPSSSSSSSPSKPVDKSIFCATCKSVLGAPFQDRAATSSTTLLPRTARAPRQHREGDAGSSTSSISTNATDAIGNDDDYDGNDSYIGSFEFLETHIDAFWRGYQPIRTTPITSLRASVLDDINLRDTFAFDHQDSTLSSSVFESHGNSGKGKRKGKGGKRSGDGGATPAPSPFDREHISSPITIPTSATSSVGVAVVPLEWMKDKANRLDGQGNGNGKGKGKCSTFSRLFCPFCPTTAEDYSDRQPVGWMKSGQLTLCNGFLQSDLYALYV